MFTKKIKPGFFLLEIIIALFIFCIMMHTITNSLGRAWLVCRSAYRMIQKEQQALTLAQGFEQGLYSLGYTTVSDGLISTINACSYNDGEQSSENLPFYGAQVQITDTTDSTDYTLLASRVV